MKEFSIAHVMEFLELPELSPSDQQWLDYLWSSGLEDIDVVPSDSLIHSLLEG